MIEPFEQLPEESAHAFKAFSLYLSLGRDRTAGAVAKRLDRCVRSIQRLSRKYHWIERTAAYDRQLARIERDAQGAILREKAADWGKRQQELREKEWQIHEECIRAGREALSLFYRKGKTTTLGDIARTLRPPPDSTPCFSLCNNRHRRLKLAPSAYDPIPSVPESTSEKEVLNAAPMTVFPSSEISIQLTNLFD